MVRLADVEVEAKPQVRQQIGSYQLIVGRNDEHGIDLSKSLFSLVIHTLDVDGKRVKQHGITRPFDKLPFEMRVALKDLHVQVEALASPAMKAGKDTPDFANADISRNG